jgi:uncharacterized membrane protein
MTSSFAVRGVAARGSHPRISLASSVIVLMFVLAVIGLGVATYLTVVHYAHQQIACNGIGNCEYVNSSKYAEVAGVPVALLGAVAYGTMAALAVAYAVSRAAAVLQAAWAVGLASFAFSMYLTGIELWVLDAICERHDGAVRVAVARAVVVPRAGSAAIAVTRGPKDGARPTTGAQVRRPRCRPRAAGGC